MAWQWTKQKENAAALVAADELTDQEIADRLGITRRSIVRWKQAGEFILRVNDMVDDWKQVVRSRGIAIIEHRVRRLDRTRSDLLRIVAERQAEAFDQLRRHEYAKKQLVTLRAELEAIEASIRRRQKPKGLIPDEVEEANAAEDVDRAKSVRDEIRLVEAGDPGELMPGQDTGYLIREVTHTKAGPVERWAVDATLVSELRALEQQAARELGQWTERVKHSGSVGSGRVDLGKLPKDKLDELERLIESATVTGGDTG